MAQVITIANRRAAVWAGIESSFASAASTTRLFPVEGTIDCKLITTEIPNNELTVRSVDWKPPVHGLQEGSTFKLKAYWRPDTTQLGTSTTATTPWLGILMRAALGGEFPASGTTNTGVTVASGGGTSITVSGGHGARLSKSAFFLPQVSNVTEPAFVTNIATDTITVTPAISNATASTTTAYNAYNYYYTEAPPPSLTIEFALADSASQQYRLLGCACTEVEIELTRDMLLAFTFTFEAAAYSGPTDLSLSASLATNPMAAPMAMGGAQLILQSTGTTTYPSAFYSVTELKMALDTGTRLARELGGVNQGKVGVMRVGPAKPTPLVKTSVVAYPDISSTTTVPVTTWWSPQLALQMQLRAYAGSGSSRRWCALAVPTAYIVGQPDGSEAADDILTYSWELHSALNGLTTSPTTDIHYSPVCFAMG